MEGIQINNHLPAQPQPIPIINTEVDNLSQGLIRYLDHLGLPSQNVLVSPDERFRVISNLPSIVERLSYEIRSEAMYISKFVAACSAGLFDAALNMLWNETVINLREKVKRFDLNYFLDSVITDSDRRASYRSEDDLVKLEEWELVKGCKDTGIISEVGYKHLNYIRDMRNHASAAHPNNNDLTGLQLVSWLETCIKEVLGKEPEGPVVQVKQLLHNLRNQTLAITDVPPIAANIQRLPVQLVDSTLRAIFGMYTSPNLSVSVRNNLKLVASSLWDCSSKHSKHDIGLKYATFSANAELDRKQYADEFLTLVNGLSYLPKDLRGLNMSQALDSLEQVHYGWNNFYNEPPHAKLLASYIPDTGEIPDSVLTRYVKIVTLCRIGNKFGVSNSAVRYYNEMINKFTDIHFNQFVLLLWDSDMQLRLQYHDPAVNYRNLAMHFAERALNTKLKEVLNMIGDPSGTIIAGTKLENVHKVSKFYDAVDQISL